MVVQSVNKISSECSGLILLGKIYNNVLNIKKLDLCINLRKFTIGF